MKVLIRADGGEGIGMGHVMRMLVLAEALEDYAEVAFICRDRKELHAGIKHIEARGYQAHKIPGVDIPRELSHFAGNCLITDSYAVDKDYFDITRGDFAVTGYMDDLNKSCINTDFIINQNIYAGELKYQVDNSTRLFMGPRYLLLREEFRGLSKRRISDSVIDVLITLGGTDPGNLSGKIAVELGQAFPHMRLHIVIGPSFTREAELEKLAGGNMVLHYDPRMAELMLKCDAAVTACGSTVYELCACGTPAIGIVTADNQLMVARKMDSIGAIKYAEGLDDLIGCLGSLDIEARRKMSELGQSLADGYGSIRLAGEIRKLLYP